MLECIIQKFQKPRSFTKITVYIRNECSIFTRFVLILLEYYFSEIVHKTLRLVFQNGPILNTELYTITNATN